MDNNGYTQEIRRADTPPMLADESFEDIEREQCATQVSGSGYHESELPDEEYGTSQRETEAENNIMETSVVIPLMGVTGSGKSTFISLLADQHVEVGHDLQSSTVDIRFYTFRTAGNRLVYLIDTPGFDDTHRPDVDILKQISAFLSTIYVKGWRLGGIIYLHRITDPRMTGTALKNLQMFQKLCGEDNFSSVVLSTTMWGELEPTEVGHQTGLKRQEQLQKQYWDTMINAGSITMDHDGSVASAKRIVSELVQRDREVVLNIVRQLVDERRTLDETDAGKAIQSDLIQAKSRFDEELIDLQESMKEAIKDQDQQAMNAIKREKQQAEVAIQRQLEQTSSLRISVDELAKETSSEFQVIAENAERQQQSSKTSRANSDQDRRIKQLRTKLLQNQTELFAQQAQSNLKLEQMQMMMEEDRLRREKEDSRDKINPLDLIQAFIGGSRSGRGGRGG